MGADWKDHVPVWLRLSDKAVRMAPPAGPGRSNTKLDMTQAIEVAQRFDRGESIARLAREYQVGKQTMADTIRRGRGGDNG